MYGDKLIGELIVEEAEFLKEQEFCRIIIPLEIIFYNATEQLSSKDEQSSSLFQASGTKTTKEINRATCLNRKCDSKTHYYADFTLVLSRKKLEDLREKRKGIKNLADLCAYDIQVSVSHNGLFDKDHTDIQTQNISIEIIISEDTQSALIESPIWGHFGVKKEKCREDTELPGKELQV